MSAVIDTPEGIAAYQLITWRGAIRLEKLGMRHSSGRSVNAYAAKQLGMPGRPSRDKVLAELDHRIAEAHANREGA